MSSSACCAEFVGRPSGLYFAENLTEHAGGAKIYLKREDLNHTGAHKINNCLGQALLAKRMGKKRVIAETGAGQHGVATRHGRRAAGPGVRGVHGRRGHPPSGAERLPHEAAGRGGAPGHQRHQHPQGRHQRGHPRLGDQRARHLLHPRQRGGAAPVPGDGARLPERDRRGGQGGSCEAAGGPRHARTPSSRAWAAAATPSASSRRSPTCPRTSARA